MNQTGWREHQLRIHLHPFDDVLLYAARGAQNKRQSAQFAAVFSTGYCGDFVYAAFCILIRMAARE